MKRAEIVAKGEVQRVGYRDVVEKIARKLKLAGFVENLKPYDVRIIAEGEDDVLNEFITQIRIKYHPTSSVSVEELDVEFVAATGEFEYFEIRRGDPQKELGESMDIVGTLLHRCVVIGVKMLDKQDQMLEKKMLSDMHARMHETFERYDSVLKKTLEKFPYEKSVFIMMPFEKKDIRLRTITDTIKETLEEHGLCGWRADDLERAIMEDMWDNIVVNMLSCKYGIAVFVDRTVLDRYTDEEITVFNANIALEVGFMKSRGLNILLLKDKRLEKLPTDIISKLYKEFDFNDPEGGVKKAVTEWIEDYQLGEMYK